MKAILNRLFAYQTLSRPEAQDVLLRMGKGEFNPSQMAAFLTVFNLRNITLDEMEGFRDAMLELCLRVDLSDFSPTDLCGTGGDGKDTFNVSTLAAFVVAGAGEKVAKHGNYGVSSNCGSSNVIEYLGYRFTADPETLKRQLDKVGICFLHAPLFHPAMKYVAPVRRELGIKTFFNMLGPMVNPTDPPRQLIGVFSLELARIYGYLYQQTDKDFLIVHSLDGYDEISLTGPFKAIDRQGERFVYPKDWNFQQIQPGQLAGGTTIPEAAQIFVRILKNEGSRAQNNAVIANAAAAIYALAPQKGITDALSRARTSLLGGHALKAFERLIQMQ
ncbi:MAG: anthranilate phosphoribosyltransferase [Bernardetiaceae bacterium]